MSAAENAAKMRVALKAVKGRLDRAEALLADVIGAIRDHSEEVRECAALLAQTPFLDGEEPGFAAFADRRRAALKARIAALNAALKSLYKDEITRRADVERYLRQKISLEDAADAAKGEAARARAKR